jgi:hypothetical protein
MHCARSEANRHLLLLADYWAPHQTEIEMLSASLVIDFCFRYIASVARDCIGNGRNTGEGSFQKPS